MLRSNLLIHLIIYMLVLLTVGCQFATPVPTIPEITPIPEIATPSATPDEVAVVDTPIASVPTTTPESALTAVTPSATHTPSLTPSVTVSPIPTITPSFTPTPSPTPSFTPTPSPTPSLTPTPTDTPTPTPTGSPLKRKENSPEGVAAQLGFSAPTLDPCQVILTPGTSIFAGPIEILDSVVICFSLFDAQQVLTVFTPLPDGSTEQHNLSLDIPLGDRFVWYPLPGLPLEDVTVIASQGTRHASAQFRMQLASRPFLVVLTKQGVPGTVFRVALAGFGADEQLPLYLYRLETNECVLGSLCWIFLTTLLHVSVNSRGEATFDLVKERDDPIGEYLITAARPGPADSFAVIRRTIPIPFPSPIVTPGGEVAP
jgi:hypothetical protein